MSDNSEILEKHTTQDYKWGFVTSIESDTLPPGLNEKVVAHISQKKGEPEWMLAWRLKAFERWKEMKEPHWAFVNYPPIDYQSICYYSAPKQWPKYKSLDEVDPELLRTYEKLGIPLIEQKQLAGVAVDAVFDSVSITTTYKEELGKMNLLIKF